MNDDNLTTGPDTDNPEQAVEQPTSVETSVPSIPGKFQGKSLEEIVEMQLNAERKITELAQKVKNYEKAAEVPAEAEKTDVYSKEAYYSDPFSYTEKRVVEAERKARTLEVGMAVLMARQDETMPDWKEHETAVLELAKQKPYIMQDPEWTKVAYKLVVEPKRLEDLKKERTKQMEDTQKQAEEAKKEVPVVSDAEQKAPPPTQVPPLKERLYAAYKDGNIDSMLMSPELLTDAEKALLGL